MDEKIATKRKELRYINPLLDCRLAVVEGLVCVCDPESLAGGGVASGRYNQTGKINGEIPD